MNTENDVFSENTPAIVDCDVLEAAKENVQPLASGRRVTTLSTILATPHAQREAKLSATRNRLRINVELALDDEDGDPLDAYCRLVYWTVENYPQGPSIESGLLELLEEATRVLKDDQGGKWRGDLKYLKLWLLYASFVERPVLIYRFLIANEIGTSFALLYEEYAAVLERDGRRKEADEAYTLGIARRATPFEHLQNRHEDFQKRMMYSTLPTVALATSPSTMRPVLASNPKSTITSTQAASLHHSNQGTSSNAIATRATSNAPLQIFVDPTGSESQVAEHSANTWTDLDTRKARIKENVPGTKKLVGTTLKQAGRSKRLAPSLASSSKISIYRDPIPEVISPPVSGSKRARDTLPKTPTNNTIIPFTDEQDRTTLETMSATPMFIPFRDETFTPGTTTTLPASESIMKIKPTGAKLLGLTSEAEALRKDPLKNYPGIDIEGGG